MKKKSTQIKRQNDSQWSFLNIVLIVTHLYTVKPLCRVLLDWIYGSAQSGLQSSLVDWIMSDNQFSKLDLDCQSGFSVLIQIKNIN